MPPVQGPEVPVAGRNIPPRRSRPGPPQDPVDHLPVIVPPTSPTRRPVRQQRLQSRPLCISQIVTIEHKTGLPGRPVKIGETRPSPEPCATHVDVWPRAWPPEPYDLSHPEVAAHLRPIFSLRGFTLPNK